MQGQVLVVGRCLIGACSYTALQKLFLFKVTVTLLIAVFSVQFCSDRVCLIDDKINRFFGIEKCICQTGE